MNTFSPDILDDRDALLAADADGMLRALASAGAFVRRAQETAGEHPFERLGPDDLPRAVLVAPDPSVPYLSNLLACVGSQVAPVIDWREPALPRWAGPADALIVASADGMHPRLAELVDQAERRGLALAVTAPADSPVAAATRRPVADVGHVAGLPPRSLWWALATPALQALEACGLGETSPLLGRVADALDETAEASRPDSSAFTAPAKVLATDIAESVAVVVGAGSMATVAARRIAAAVQLFAGSTAMAAALPDDIARIGALLEFSSAETDFFADRVTDGIALPRLVMIGDDDPFGSGQTPYRDEDAADPLGELAARRAGATLLRLAGERGIAGSRILVPDAPALVRFAVATAVGDLAACYLALGRGIDPAAPRLGEGRR